jgi:hypothetical protein
MVYIDSGNKVRKYNTEYKIILNGYASAIYHDAVATWSCTSNKTLIDVNNIALTPLMKNIPFVATGLHQLSLAPYSLSIGYSYTFRLDAAYKNDLIQKNSTFITISINSPPYGEYLSVLPLSGIASIDLFTFNAGLWTDDTADYPLSYVFSYFTQSPLP